MRNSPEHFSHRERLNARPAQIENISNEILESDESLRYLRSKIQQKIEFKEQISHDDGTNDFSPWKRLGIFIVHEQKLPDELISILQRNNVDIYNDEVLELHIPPQEISLADVKKSFERLQEYLNANSSNRSIAKYIYGVSYLANLAKRYGFTVVNLPTGIQENTGASRVLKSYAAATTDSKKLKIAEKFSTRDIRLCYMSVDDLLASKLDAGKNAARNLIDNVFDQ